MLRYLIFFLPLFAQPWIPKNWVVVGVGNTASRPATCTSNKHAYINSQTNSVDYCLAAAWVSLSSGAVSSVFSRTGAVTAQSGDYTAAQVTNAASLIAANSHTAGTKNTFAADATTAGAKVTCSALPSTPATGDVACDSGDANKLKWWDGSSWLTAGSSANGLGDPGSNSIVYRTSSTTSRPATTDDLKAIVYISDAGGDDAYSGSPSNCPASIQAGQHYRLTVTTANTGAASLDPCGFGAKTIKKVAGGITTDLADNDIRSGQFVELVYDGTNMQMQSTLGNAAASASGMTLVEQYTASSSASLNFTTCISATYDEYRFEFVNVVPATNAVEMYMQVSTDGGSSWVAGTSYTSWWWGFSTGGATQGGGTSRGALRMGETTAWHNSSLYGVVGYVNLYSPASTALHKQIEGKVSGKYNNAGSPASYGSIFGGTYDNTTAVNAVRFLFASGNIASGTIRCYGLAK